MDSSVISLLVGGLKRVTHAFRYALIAYIMDSSVSMDIISSYVDNKPVVYGAKGLSIAQKIDIRSLKYHFLKDIPLAKTCFETDVLREKDIIKLKNKCKEAFEKSPVLSSIVNFALRLNELSGKQMTLSEL